MHRFQWPRTHAPLCCLQVFADALLLSVIPAHWTIQTHLFPSTGPGSLATSSRKHSEHSLGSEEVFHPLSWTILAHGLSHLPSRSVGCLRWEPCFPFGISYSSGEEIGTLLRGPSPLPFSTLPGPYTSQMSLEMSSDYI